MFEKLLAKQHIRNLDLESVRANLVEKRGWSPEQAQQVESDYKRFLYALAHGHKHDILSPPTKEVDEFWHQHILDTRKYREDCNTVFGHYVDHTPGLSAENQRKADAKREQIYADYDIDSASFDGGSPRESSHNGGFDGCGSGDSHGSHHSHSGHDSGHAHSGEAGAHGDSGAGDSGGDGGSGGDGSGCGGGGCGGG
ncbi:MAG TPA: hypothetical protein VH724_21215 [Candidatus Angelobacter sp.]|nr:hypothetical protein [Candidatus Angelobacter sp.]